MKPYNIFITRGRDGRSLAKLLDFGIIKLAQANSTNQTGTHFIGTFRYAPPEQILGREITPRADLYAAALVLYERLAGRSPFEEFRNDIDKAQVDRQPPPLSTFVSVPPALDRLVQSALAKDPQARPADAYTFGQVLLQLRQELKGAASDVHDKATVAAVVTSLTGIPENQPNSVLSDDQVSDFPRPVLQTPTVMTPGATNAPTTPLMAGAPYNGTLLSPQQAPIGATQLMPAPAFASTLPLNARQPDDRLSHASVQSAQSVPLVAPPLRPSADALPIPLVPPTPTFASGCSDAFDELDDRLMIGQGSASPVLRNMTEEAMFDLVPLGGPWREVGNADGNASVVGKALQFEFPHSRARCIAAPSVGGDEQLLGLGVGALAHTLAPIGNGANSKLWSVVIDADVDPSRVVVEIVDAIRNHFAKGVVDEVVDADRYGLTSRLPLGASVLEVANQLFLLGIDRDHRRTACLKIVDTLADEFELLVAVPDARRLQVSCSWTEDYSHWRAAGFPPSAHSP